MPPPPELLRCLGLIGAVEVHRQVEAHEHGYADSDVRIAGEIRIDLQRVGKEREEVFEAGEEKRVIEDAVDEVHRQVVGHDDLLCQTVEDPEDRDTEGSAA